MSVAENFSLFPLSKWYTRKSGPGFPTAESTHETLVTGNVTGTNITSGTYEIYRLHHFDKSPNFKWHIILIKNFSTGGDNTTTNPIPFSQAFDPTLKVYYVITGSILTAQGTHGININSTTAADFTITSDTITTLTQFTNDFMVFQMYGF